LKISLVYLQTLSKYFEKVKHMYERNLNISL